jgi:coenzyme PQQ synthesis protein D (PqqD)
LSARFVKDNQSVTRSIAGETIIVPVRSGVGDLDSIYTLNEVGTSIWELIDGTRSVEQIVEEIGNKYEVSSDEAAKDVSEFLTALQVEGLIHLLPERGE